MYFYIKTSITSLLKRKWLTMVLMVQLIIAFNMLIDSTASVTWFINNFIEVNRVLDKDLDEMVRVQFILPQETEQYNQSLIALETYIQSLDHVVGYGSYNTYTTSFSELVTREDYSNPSMRIEDLTTAYPELDPSYLEAVWMKTTDMLLTDEVFYTVTAHLNMSQGRGLTHTDFNHPMADAKHQAIPALAGYNLGQYLPVGTILSYENDAIGQVVQYEIVGVLDAHSKWSPDGGVIGDPPMSVDNKLICPFVREEKRLDLWSNLTALSTTTYVLDDVSAYEAVKGSIGQKAEALGLYIQIDTYETLYNEFKNSLKDFLGMNGFVSLVFLFAAVLSVIIGILSSIVYRKREFGIRIACGYSKKEIEGLIRMEVTIIVALALLIAYGINLYETRLVTRATWDLMLIGKHNFLRHYGLGILGLMGGGIIGLASLIPCYKIRQMQPVALLHQQRRL